MAVLIIIKLVTEAVGAICKLVGELWWHNAQRFILPPFYAVAVSIESGCWWLGLTVLPMIGFLVLGYKDFGSSNGFDRGVWLFLISAAAGLGPALHHNESWLAYVPLAILAGIWGGVTRNWLNLVIAPISGLLIVAHIWFIHG